MNLSKTFIASTFLVLSGSIAVGYVLVIPTPLDALFAYQQDTRPLAPSLSPQAVSLEHTEAIAPEMATIEPTPTPAAVTEDQLKQEQSMSPQTVFDVPFYSQFNDISSPSWKKVGCGVASLAMLIEFHAPETVTVDTLLQEGIESGAYIDDVGWSYAGLIGISHAYGLDGETHDYGKNTMEVAYEHLTQALKEGPVMASVHYTFQKTNPIPHLVVINGIEDGMVHYNDPAEGEGGGSITVEQFQSAWKKRYIEFYRS